MELENTRALVRERGLPLNAGGRRHGLYSMTETNDEWSGDTLRMRRVRGQVLSKRDSYIIRKHFEVLLEHLK